MKRFVCGVAALMMAGTLLLGLGGCAQQSPSSSGSADQSSEQSSVVQKTEQVTSDSSRIDVEATGSQVATFHGAKYIVSDATVDQSGGNSGYQEICVVNQPQSWEHIGSIGWDRNSISYLKIQTAWGDASYRYEYLNEGGANAATTEWSRTTEESFFAGAGEVLHAEIGDHKVAYVYVDQAVPGANGEGIADLEAEAAGVDTKNSGRTVTVYAYEQRADKCAFVVTATCTLADSSATAPAGEQILQDALASVEFAQKDAQIDAASYLSDVSISNGDNTTSVVIARNGDSLLSFAEHSVVLLGNANTGSTVPTVTYDFDHTEVPADAEEYEAGGRRVRATVSESSWQFETEAVVERVINAYVEIDGATLHIEASMAEGEEIQTALDRLIGSRIL